MDKPIQDNVSTAGLKAFTNTSYIIAVVSMIAIGFVTVILLALLRPTQDLGIIIVAVFGVLTPTTLSLLSFIKAQETNMQAQETHILVNSRMSTFMETLERSAQDKSVIAKAEGVVEGVAQGTKDANQRTDELANK
jgi:hypothetical protein